MPLKTKPELIRGLTINWFQSNKELRTPVKIYIYELPNIIVKSNTSMGEYYLRQQLRGLMKPFEADLYIDKNYAWGVSPPCHNIFKIGLCGLGEKTIKNVFNLLINFIKKYKIPFKNIFFCGSLTKFQSDFATAAEQLGIEVKKDINFDNELKEDVIPECKYQVYFNNNWQLSDNIHAITGLLLNSNIGQLTYRVHFYNREWSKWENNNTPIQSESSIDGLQYEFISDNYQLEHQVILQDNRKLPWKSKTLFAPYGKFIQSINFRLIKKEENCE